MLTHHQVRNAREKLGLTQRQTADALGLATGNGKDTVRSWECEPSAKRYRAITGPAGLLLLAFLDGWEPKRTPDGELDPEWLTSLLG